MINTATDNIQYRGDVARNIYQKNNQIYRRPESEHYKVKCSYYVFIISLDIF